MLSVLMEIASMGERGRERHDAKTEKNWNEIDVKERAKWDEEGRR